MKSLFRKYWLLILILCAIVPIARFCHYQTRGMILTKFLHNTAPFEAKNVPMAKETKELLDQKFIYFARGLQSFSFLSEDGKTVLKIFNNRYQRRLYFLRWLPSSAWKHSRINYNLAKWEQTFRSYQLSNDLLQKETGLIHMQLSPQNHHLSTTLIDKLGIAHHIDLNVVAFALQKKAVMAYEYLSNCSPSNAKSSIEKIVQLTHHKIKLGLKDNDPLTRTNLGFLDEKPMQIDLGPFTKNQETYKQETVRIDLLSLKHWLEKNHPEYVKYLDESIQNL